MSQPARRLRPAKSLAALAEEYRAVREATRAMSPLPLPAETGLDFSALGLAYHALKQRNQLAVLINRGLRRSLIPAFPVEIQINNIGFCNLRCPHCPTHGTDEVHERYQAKTYTMSRASIEKIAGETFPYAEKVGTSGLGEGLLHKDLDVIVTQAWRYGVRFFTNTNGTTLLPKLVGRLFGVTELRLSLDGATPPVFEAVRRGASYAKVMRNVLAVSRANERLPPTLRMVPTVNYGICASGIRDLPLMVDLCAHLGLGALHGFRIVPTNPRYDDDDIANYPAFYKHYYLQAMQRARARHLHVNLPEPDPQVEPDADVGPKSDRGMIVSGVDDSYYRRLPTFDRLFDNGDLEAEIEGVMRAALEAGIERHSAATPAAVREAATEMQRLDGELAAEIQRAMATLAPAEIAHLKAMHRSDAPVTDCPFLHRYLTYYADGAVRACCDADIEPIGHETSSAREILHGPAARQLVGEFASGAVRPGCARCPMLRTVPERELFPIALQ